MPDGLVGGEYSTHDHFELAFLVENRYNRLLLFRENILHRVETGFGTVHTAQEAGMQVDQTDLAYVTAERDRLMEKYGRIFDRDYGWAACLFPNKNLNKDCVNFAELEKK